MNADVQVPSTEPANKGKQIIKQVILLGVALFFLWMAFRGTDMAHLWAEVQRVDMPWIWAVCAVAIFSHFVRAWRWTLLLRPLSDHPIGLWNSFCAVMIGYAVNIAVPRGGEVARVISISKSEKLPWVGVVPTMFIDRLLDIAMLVLLLGVTLAMLPPELREQMHWLVNGGIALCVATVVGLGVLPFVGRIIKHLLSMEQFRSRVPDKVGLMGLQLADEFDRGTSSLRNPVGLPAIALLSVAIWACYFVSFYLGMMAFRMQNEVDLSHGLMIFSVGSVAVIVPTPGALGTYHLAVSQALQQVSHIEAARATAFVTVFHAITFVLVVCVVAAICFLIQQATRKDSADGENSNR
jgi:uncharacterized protein (TIRG00374 family)